MKILLLTPPMTQLNTPYPATAYLTGFLRERGHDARQADPAIELMLRLLSRPGLQAIADALPPPAKRGQPRSLAHFRKHLPRYLETVEPVVRYLQGRDPTLAWRLASPDFLPRGPRFEVLAQYGPEGDGDPLGWAFGSLGLRDRAQYLATLYVDDLADVIREGVDPRFEMSRYGEKLASSAASFEPLRAALEGPPTLVDRLLDEITAALLDAHAPEVVGLTVPFPGNVYGALRIARTVRRLRPGLPIVMGGGFVNTELRDLAEPAFFDYVDYLVFDDGEAPLLALLDHLAGRAPADRLLRTMVRVDGRLVTRRHPELHDVPFRDAGTPTYDGLPLDRYLSVVELLNPMHRLWSDGRWNKLTLAHGCYWKKCTFCDITLDYIGRYDGAAAALIVDRMERLIAETGATGFHFVDEAAPPKTLAAVSEEILRRGLTVTWWGNIRFEKTFTPELCGLMARAGCIAVTGGLEAASDRLLALMSKGVTVEQVARVTHAFTEAGVMVHAYLMYGFPTQTVQETVDALERVRQLFAAGCLQSAYWHRFAATVHAPVGQDPARFGVTLRPVRSTFARNEVAFDDPTGVDHDALAVGLRKALYNYMHGLGLEDDVRRFFDLPVPKPRVPRRLIEDALR